MSIFYVPEIVNIGGKNLHCYRAAGMTVQDMMTFSGSYSSYDVRLVLPPKKGTMKSRTMPRLLINARERFVLDEVEACPVPEEYMKILYYLLKKDFLLNWSHDKATEADLAKVDSHIRQRVMNLIFSGEWISDPEHSSLETLNQQIEKIDLGRYKGLKPGQPIPREYHGMRANFQGYERKEAELEQKFKKEAKSNPQQETPFQKWRREQG